MMEDPLRKMQKSLHRQAILNCTFKKLAENNVGLQDYFNFLNKEIVIKGLLSALMENAEKKEEGFECLDGT